MLLGVYEENQSISIEIETVVETVLNSIYLIEDATAVSVKVLDANSGVLVNTHSVTPSLLGTTFKVEVSDTHNAIAVGKKNDLRYVIATITAGNGTIYTAKHHYVLSKADSLGLMVNSFQTLSDALILSSTLIGVNDFIEATYLNKIVGLQMAFMDLCNVFYEIDNPSSVSTESIYGISNRVEGRKIIINNLAGVSETVFNTLPSEFVDALKHAQLIQANHVLGYENSIAGKIDAGIVSETVGESTTAWDKSFRSMRLPLCSEAMSRLSRFIATSARIARA